MDIRDVTANKDRWYKRINERAMTVEAEIDFIDDEGFDCSESMTVPITFEVCPLCDGKGSHVNPSIDAHGITGDEWAEWDDCERESYFRGGYDVPCHECGGLRVVPEPDKERMDKETYKRVTDYIDRLLSYAYERTRELEMGY